MTAPNTVSALLIDHLGFNGVSLTVDGVTWPESPVPVLFNNKQVGTATTVREGDRTIATLTVNDDSVWKLIKEGK